MAAAGLDLDDIGLVELNEAFAAQAVACIRLLGMDEEKVNVNGGAIALGHPLGCSGARLVGTLVREMNRRQVEFGLATMCIGVGQGISSIWQLVGTPSASSQRSASAAASVERRPAEVTMPASSTVREAMRSGSRT
jgi:hypothetical protein